jgi:hypothetical protein
MRKAINISALIVFIWLALDVLHIQDMLLGFILVGAIPGTAITLPPTFMFALLTALTIIIVFELLARRVESLKRVRHQLITKVSHLNRFPSRFGRA